MVERTEELIHLPDGTVLSAWLFVPDGPGPHAAVTMAHGFGGTKYHGIEPIARELAEAGFVVSLHDHRGFGESGGEPRQDIDPYRQIEDWRRVIAHLQTLDAVDPDRIGLWGTSYSGGHALVLAATDRRIKAVYSQVPTVSGSQSSLRRVPPHLVGSLEAEFAADELAQARGEAPASAPFVSDDPAVTASYRNADAIRFYLEHDMPEGVWENRVTLQSNRRSRSYDPGHWIDRISPTPLMMLVATHDTVAPTDLALSAYERALEPKELVIMPGGHFDPYTGDGFRTSTTAAVRFFRGHLRTE
ncbi:alpha/beta hydrolase [Streptomyces sp. MI02-7b]|uniref:alpha/beta hydrolase n=1 Tax=Streptomyces sp. MI02-7b TaxID=462941 RepID=UPI0029B20F82|nr:alpha/beta hydrolase [Streptomyces sp. MI02-7b]MDX3072587.1 alpha/beta hydrolase [Streptomyces sp. MI02-7b]